MQKSEVGPDLIPYIKINSKWIRDLNLRTKTVKLLEKKTGEHHGIEFGDDFLPKAQATKKK